MGMITRTARQVYETERSVISNRKTVFGEAILSNDYFNDNNSRGQGETGLNKTHFGFDIISFVQLECPEVSLRYDKENERIRVFLYNDSGGGQTAAFEATDGYDLSNITFSYWALGT